MSNNSKNFIAHIRALISQNKLAEALQRLQELLADSPQLSQVLLQSKRFEEILQEKRDGLITFDVAHVETNRITEGVLRMLSDIEKYGEVMPDVKEEVERYVVHFEKNVLKNSNINAKGNVNIGDTYNSTPIERQTNLNDGSTYIEYQFVQGKHEVLCALTPPPFLPEVFLGREADLKAIRQHLFSGDNVLLLVNGQGGVGKTSIAAKYYRTHADDYAHTAWVLSERSIANALVSNLAPPLGIDFPPTMREAEKLQILLRGMAALAKPCLLVIDNANERDDLKQNYQNLRRCPNFHLLLTSRLTQFAQAQTYLVEGLPEPKAIELFGKYYKKFSAAEVPLFKHIRAAVGGNTLVVELLAKNLYLFNRLRQHYTLADLLKDLQTKGVLALSQSQVVKTDYQSKNDALRKEKPEAIIEAMYDLGELPREEVALLSVFAVLPAEPIGLEWLEMLLPDSTDLEQLLLNLAQKGWIDYEETDTTFKCSPVVQAITRKKNGMSLRGTKQLRGDCQTLMGALIEKLDRDNIHEDNYKYSTVFTRYAEAVIAAFDEPDFDIQLLCERIGIYNETIGNLDKAFVFYKKESDILKKLCEIQPNNADFKNGLAISYEKLGETHSALGNLDKALGFYEERNKLGKDLYAAYPTNVEFKNGLAISYEKLGQTHSALGNLDKALGFYEEYNRLEKELHAAYPTNVSFKNGLAISYEKLGQTHSALGNLDKALGFYEEFTNLMKELYAAYPTNVSFKNGLAISYEKLGQTHSALGNLDKALGFYEERNKLGKELYAAYPTNVSFKNGLAISYSKLGQTHSALGNLGKALGFYKEQTRLFEELYAAYPTNVSFKNGLAISYSKLGETHSALGNLDKALGFYEEWNKLGKELYAAYPTNVSFKNGLAVSYQWLGWFYENKKNNKQKAKEYYEASEKLLIELATSFPSYKAFQTNLQWVQGALKRLS